MLALVTGAFFLLAGGNFQQFGKPQRVLQVVAALPLAVSGMGHFFRTAIYAAIVPPVFPHAGFWVVLTGVLELAGAVGLLFAGTTRTASVCLAVLMIAVFPANVYAANQTVGGLHMPSVPVRLAMQIFYVILLLLAGWGVPGRKSATGE